MWYKKYAVDEYMCQAKESIKELKQMVDQADAKKMGYGEFNVYKKMNIQKMKLRRSWEERLETFALFQN